MVFDDLLEDVFERDDKPGKRRSDEEDDEGNYDKRGKKRGFFDRISELFD